MSALALSPASGAAVGLSRWQRWAIERAIGVDRRRSVWERVVTWMSGFSEAMAEGVLGHVFAKTALTKPAEIYLALLTSTPTSASTGESIEASEATYTGYVRLKLDPTKFKLTKAATSTIKNELELTFAACTGLEKTVTAWAVTEKKRAEACNIVMWGTATSTVISSTQTPPTIAPEKLVGELK